MDYESFLKSKAISTQSTGFEVPRENLNKKLFDWQRDIVFWALKKGKAALFEDCGAGKTAQLLEWSRQVHLHTQKPVLVVSPLAVAEQTKREGVKFGIETKVCRENEQVVNGINITNYEILEHFDLSRFVGVVLDESSILKAYDGKTKQTIIESFRKTPYKLSCTATPSPNDYMELGNQAEFLGIMSRGEMLATFFVHDGGDTSKWRLKGHAETKFWEWVASWAVVLTNPADLGYDGSGFVLPPLHTEQVSVCPDTTNSVGEQMTMFASTAQTLTERRDARRSSLKERCEAAKKLREREPDAQWLFWVDLNAEADELKSIMPDAVEVRGTDSPEYKADKLNGFTIGEVRCLISKPSIAGFGLNWQCCHNMVFVGLSDSYEMFYQAMRRCWRFGQTEEVNVYIVISEQEGAVKENIERKEKQAATMQAEMVKFTKNILEKEIRGTCRETIAYDPQIQMIVPIWCREEKELQWRKI